MLSVGIYYTKSSSLSALSEVPTPKAQVAIPQGFHGCRRGHLPTPETAFAPLLQCHLKGCCLLPALSPSCDPSSPVHLHGPMHLQKGFSRAGEARLKMGNFLKVSLENSLTTPYHKKIMTAPIFNSHHPSVPTFLPSLILYLFCPVPTASHIHHPWIHYLCSAEIYHPSGTEHNPILQQAYKNFPLTKASRLTEIMQNSDNRLEFFLHSISCH